VETEHFELELCRISTQGLRSPSRSIDRHIPAGRSERITLYPGWPQHERSEFLRSIAATLIAAGFTARILFRPRLISAEVVAQEQALDEYLAEATHQGSHWPQTALLWEDPNGAGAVVQSDADRMKLYIDSWGADARAVCDEVFSAAWNSVRKMRPP
jgi:hypothetical protein